MVQVPRGKGLPFRLARQMRYQRTMRSQGGALAVSAVSEAYGSRPEQISDAKGSGIALPEQGKEGAAPSAEIPEPGRIFIDRAGNDLDPHLVEIVWIYLSIHPLHDAHSNQEKRQSDNPEDQAARLFYLRFKLPHRPASFFRTISVIILTDSKGEETGIATNLYAAAFYINRHLVRCRTNQNLRTR